MSNACDLMHQNKIHSILHSATSRESKVTSATQANDFNVSIGSEGIRCNSQTGACAQRKWLVGGSGEGIGYGNLTYREVERQQLEYGFQRQGCYRRRYKGQGAWTQYGDDCSQPIGSRWVNLPRRIAINRWPSIKAWLLLGLQGGETTSLSDVIKNGNVQNATECEPNRLTYDLDQHRSKSGGWSVDASVGGGSDGLISASVGGSYGEGWETGFEIGRSGQSPVLSTAYTVGSGTKYRGVIYRGMFWPHYAIAKGVASVLAEFNQGTWNFNNDNAYIIYVAPEYPHVLATVVSAAHIMLFTLEMEEGENNQWHVASVSPTGALRHYFEGVEYLVGGDFDEDQTSQNLGGLKYSLGKRTQSAISEGGDSPARDRMYLKLPGGESYPAPLQDTEPANQ